MYLFHQRATRISYQIDQSSLVTLSISGLSFTLVLNLDTPVDI